MLVKQFTTINGTPITIGKDQKGLYEVIENHTRGDGGNLAKGTFNCLKSAIDYVNDNYTVKRVVV